MNEDFPLLLSSPNDTAIINPEDFVRYRLKTNIKVPQYCIISFYKELIDLAKKKYNAKRLKWITSRAKLYCFKYKGTDIAIIYCGMGAAFTAILLEDLIASGIENFIIIGTAGTLQDYLNIGDIILATKSIRDEGTSYHYAKPSKYASPSKIVNRYLEKSLQKENIRYYKGVSWTIDAFYRETITKAKKYKAEGVLCAEMEASALFTIAEYRKKDLGALFIISDNIAKLKWTPGFHLDNVTQRKFLLLKVASEAFRLMTHGKTGNVPCRRHSDHKPRSPIKE